VMNSNWYNFGGYKTWLPRKVPGNAGGWPPPPTLDYGAYTVLDSVVTADSVAVEVVSPVEQWYATGIRFVRRATLYQGSTHVKMEQTVINQGASPVTWSVWGVTESIVNHTGMKDYSNYWVYFPTNPHSLYGTSGVKANGTSKAWKGEVAPGVYGVQFVADNKKIFADPQKGWIAYASLSDSTIFCEDVRRLRRDAVSGQWKSGGSVCERRQSVVSGGGDDGSTRDTRSCGWIVHVYGELVDGEGARANHGSEHVRGDCRETFLHTIHPCSLGNIRCVP